MDVIEVPAVPKESFNKNRRISDLIRAQIAHLKHLEQKLPPKQRGSIPQHGIVTENDAAIYIAAMTRLLCAGPGIAEAPVGLEKRIVPIRVPATLDLAAAAEESNGKKQASKKASTKSAKRKPPPRGQR